MSPASSERFIVVADIHGDDKRLAALLALLADQRERLIFVGDYVNRGPASSCVIQRLLDLRRTRPDTCFLLGNHDYAFETYLGGGDFASFARIGGIATIRSYVTDIVHKDVRGQLSDMVPRSHREFLTSLRPFWENENFLVSHVGFNPHDTSDRSLKSMALQDHPSIFASKGVPSKVAVFGHYIQESWRPFISPTLVCLDTGCGARNGPLTAMLFPEQIVFSV
jgi:serine/threonine protein phosphatase 1